jgi:ribonuclease HI
MAIQPRVKVFFDGGYRSGTARMETAVVVRGREYLQRDLGPGSSMEAEWLALIRAVEIAGELGLSNALFLGDALPVVQQAMGQIKCRRPWARHLEVLERIGASCRSLEIRHIRRSQNLAGIALCRLHVR